MLSTRAPPPPGPCYSGIVLAKELLEAINYFGLEAWGYAFLVSALLWALAMLLGIALLVMVALWYRQAGGERPQIQVRRRCPTGVAGRGGGPRRPPAPPRAPVLD